MNKKLEYYKEFWMFNQENEGVNINGYVKIEVKNSKGRINIFASDIKLNLIHHVYLIKSNNFKSVYLGSLKKEKNVGILLNEFNAVNVGNTGCDITNFDIVVVVNIKENNRDITIIPQAVAYKNKEIPWKENLKKELLRMRNYPDNKPTNIVTNYISKNKMFPCNNYYFAGNNKKVSFNKILPTIPQINRVYNMFDIEIFKRQMDVHFRRCNPFFNVRQDYIWWDIRDVNKMYYFLQMFNIEVSNLRKYPLNKIILGLYKNIQKTYVVIGFLLINNREKADFDKIVEVKNSKINLKYGLIFKNPYKIEKVN